MADLPDSVDCLIIGTGLTNSILAAACARVGKSVLHIDNKGYYGDEWASFTFQQLLDWVDINKKPIDFRYQPPEMTIELNLSNDNVDICLLRPLRERLFSNLEIVDCTANQTSNDKNYSTPSDSLDLKEKSTGEEDKKHAETILNSKSRYFCFDLAPHLIYSNASIVELLVKSNVARYHEFKNCIKILALINDKLHFVPFTRSDLFSSSIGLIDRRRLMQLLEACFALDDTRQGENNAVLLEESNSQTILDNSQMPFEEYLEKRGLNQTLRDYLIHSVAMVDRSTPTFEACKSIRKFLLSFERFGKSPFLFPMYGCGEFPQSFCRLSAVFGGTYCLNKQIDNLKVIKSQNNQCSCYEQIKFVATLEGKKIKCKKIIMKRSDGEALGLCPPDKNEINLSRSIVVTDQSIRNIPAAAGETKDDSTQQDTLYFMRIPEQSYGNQNAIYVLEVNSSVMVAPSGVSIIYVWTESNSIDAKARSELSQTVEQRLLNGKRPLFCCYYNQKSSLNTNENVYNVMGEIYLTSPPSGCLDYDDVVKESEFIFKKMYPHEEFLPRAPDPDEIIFQSTSGGEEREAQGSKPDFEESQEATQTLNQYQESKNHETQDSPSNSSERTVAVNTNDASVRAPTDTPVSE